MLNISTTTWISRRASELGFAMSGIVRAEKFPELARDGEWLERGYAGDMKYLSDPRRNDLHNVMPGVQSVIVCALTYNTEHDPTAQAISKMSTDAQDKAPYGWISRYAWGDDYHEVLRAKLETLLEELRNQHAQPFEGRVYADTGPLNERVLAKYAGLGWLGRNTLLLNEQLGSFFFLGVILTTLDLQPTVKLAMSLPADRCGTCRKCLDACPTEALVEPYVMDARKCISYLTIELRGAIPAEFRESMGLNLFGCDICQDVCPWNRSAPVTQAKEFQPRTYRREILEMGAPSPRSPVEYAIMDSGETRTASQESLFLPNLEWLASLDEREFRDLFRGSAIKRTKWKGLLRNVCIALGNSKPARDSAKRAKVSALLARLAASDDPVVAESARWAISHIQENDGQETEG
jgi:epoxyqueuosine reductase